MGIMFLKESATPMFWYGFLWGLCGHFMHLYGIVVGIVHLAAYKVWYAWLPGIVLVVYVAITTGIMWALGSWSERFFSAHNMRYFLRGVWLWLYWLWMTYACLWPLGRCEGYLLANPVIPWAAGPYALISVVSVCGVSGATLILCLSAASIVFAWQQKKHFVIMGLFLFLTIVVMLDNTVCLRVHDVHKNSWLEGIVSITTPIVASIDEKMTCLCIRDCVETVFAECENVCGIVFPESCFYPWSLCAESILAQYVPKNDRHCDYLIGSFYDDNGTYRNSCYWLRDGVLQKRFDKRHAMPLIERLPWWLDCIKIKKLFFATMPEIVPSNNERPVMQLGATRCVPYICSELFFNRLPDDTQHDLPILGLVNDRWAPPYLQQLMYLGAVVQAHVWHREILYVSYSRCKLIFPVRLPLDFVAFAQLAWRN